MESTFTKILQALAAARELPSATRIEMVKHHIRERIIAFEQTEALGTQEFLRQIMDYWVA